MTKRTAFWIFLLGTLSSSILFLYLTVDTHRQVETLSHADKIDDRIVAGKRTFQKYNCNDCHTILGFGAYALLNLTVFYFAIPKIRGIERFDDRRGRLAFWTMCVAMMVMGLTFGVAGVLQSYIERVLGMGYMTAQGYMRLWMGVTLFAGVFFFMGVVTMVTDLLTLRPAREPAIER